MYDCVPLEAEEVIRFLRIRIIDGCELQCGPLEEQLVLLLRAISADLAWHSGGDPTASVTGMHIPCTAFLSKSSILCSL